MTRLSDPRQNLRNNGLTSTKALPPRHPGYQRIGLVAAIIILTLLHPAVKYVLPFAFLVAYLVVNAKGQSGDSRRFLLYVFVGAVVLRAVFALGVHQLALPEGQAFRFPDERAYHAFSGEVASAWHRGEYPRLSRDVWLGTLHTGYYRIIAAVYYLFGVHYWLGIAVNIVFSALVPVLLYFLADGTLGRRAARIAAVVAAVWPAFIFWSAFLLKDSVHAAFFLLAIAACWELVKGYRDLPALVLLGAVYFLSLLRAYSAAIILASLGGYLVLFAKRRTAYLAALAWLIFLYALARQTYQVSEYEKNLIYSLLNVIPDQCKTVIGSLRYFGLGLPKLLLAPYAWVFAPYFDIHYLLYPGQWLFYLAVIPLGAVGTYYVLKEDRREFFLALFPVALNLLVFLLAYEGSVPRQRLHLEPLLFLLAAYGLEKKGRKWFYVGYYVLLAAFIIAHLISIRGHWSQS